MRFPAVAWLLVISSPVAAADVWTFGGEALFRAEAASNFQVAGENLTRIRPTATAAVTEGLSLLAQGQWYADRASIYQAYADLTRGALQVRAGRQEIVLGSGFLLGADTFHDGASFDAVRAGLRTPGSVALDVFAGRYVKENAGGLEGALYGASASWGNPDARALAVDLLHSTAGGVITGTVAIRALLVRGPLRVDLEPCRQGGNVWGGHADVAFTLPGQGAARLGASYAWAQPGFRHPDHDTGYSGDIGVVGDLSAVSLGDAQAQGLSSASAFADLPLGTRTRLSAALHHFHAAATTDGLPHGLGREIDLVLSRTFSPRVAAMVGAHRFDGNRPTGLRVLYGWAGLALTF